MFLECKRELGKSGFGCPIQAAVWISNTSRVTCLHKQVEGSGNQSNGKQTTDSSMEQGRWDCIYCITDFFVTQLDFCTFWHFTSM